VITLEDGSELAYRHAVIATGVEPRRLPGPRLDGVQVLRTLEDAVSFKQRLLPGRRLVVVGAGFLGLEVAASARRLGVGVTVVEPVERPLATRIGGLVSRHLLDLHRREGVDVRTGVGVESLVGEEAVRGVELTDGSTLAADVVLEAIGCSPCVQWLKGSGLNIDDGLLCDEYCAAAAGLWAVGDVSRWRHLALGRDIRLEHRMNANEQARAVASNIMGEMQPFEPIPYFWTDQYDVRIQMWGVVVDSSAAVLLDGSDSDGSFVVGFFDGDRLVGAVGWNAAKLLAKARLKISATWQTHSVEAA
jgi:NADPH-dependent 2,4-dienoyl-CoA reductase/sulfur reductase-like enzyme